MWLWVPTPPPFSPFAAASILISISISKTAIYHKHLACYKHIIQHPTTLWPLRRLASRYHSPRWMIFDSALFTSSQRLSMSLCVHMSIKQNKSLVWCVYVINFLSVLLNAHFHLKFFFSEFFVCSCVRSHLFFPSLCSAGIQIPDSTSNFQHLCKSFTHFAQKHAHRNTIVSECYC